MRGVFSPMILMAVLLVLTVPSDPNPQNLQLIVLRGSFHNIRF